MKNENVSLSEADKSHLLVELNKDLGNYLNSV